ncbi:hypothetical protein [Bacillus coahuilensis]|nr:hypothetical protein [Bacillus coahuilensis]
MKRKMVAVLTSITLAFLLSLSHGQVALGHPPVVPFGEDLPSEH